MSLNKDAENTSSTVGEILKKRREKMRFSLDKVVRKTKITYEYLFLIENGEWDKLPGDIYVKNFLKSYAEVLSLDYFYLLREYEKEKKVHSMVKKANIEAFGEKVQKQNKQVNRYTFTTSLILKNLIIVSTILLILFFLGYKVSKIISPPAITVYSPENNLTTDRSDIHIIGQTEIGSTVLVNGQSIIIGIDGKFDEKINLQSGLNTIKISASKKYSKTIDIFKEVMVK